MSTNILIELIRELICFNLYYGLFTFINNKLNLGGLVEKTEFNLYNRVNT